jgi:tetratricopeptide (TPR) repeat protein
MVLPDEARQLLQAAAVAGRTVERSTLIAVLAASEQHILTGLDAACGSRLLLRDARATYRFAHDVVRETIEGDLGEGQRILLHRKVAEALEQLPEPARTKRAAELAWHFLEGDVPRRALVYAIAAGDVAREIFAHDEAERQYRMAAQISQDVRDGSREAEALEKLGTLCWTLGRYEEALSILEQAASVNETLSDLNALGQVAGKIGWAHSHRGTLEEGIARLRPIANRLEEAGPGGGLVDVYDALTHLYKQRGNQAYLVTAAQRAAEVAQALGDDKLQVRGELNHGLALMWHHDRETALHVLEQVIPRAEKIRDTDSLFRALNWTAIICAEAGEFDRAKAYAERAVEVTKRGASPSFHTTALARLADVLFELGDWKSARECGERAITVEPAAFSWATGDAHLGLARLALLEGRPEDAAAHLKEANAIFDRTGFQRARPVVQLLLAQNNLLEGQASSALARLEPLEQEPQLQDNQGQVLAEALLDSGNVERAASIVDEGIRDTRASGRRMALMDWLRLRAALLIRGGRWNEACAVLEEGIALARQMPHLYGEGRILHAMGQMHAARGEAGQARERWEEALGIFRRLGARPSIERTERALNALAPGR